MWSNSAVGTLREAHLAQPQPAPWTPVEAWKESREGLGTGLLSRARVEVSKESTHTMGSGSSHKHVETHDDGG